MKYDALNKEFRTYGIRLRIQTCRCSFCCDFMNHLIIEALFYNQVVLVEIINYIDRSKLKPRIEKT